MSEPCVVTLDRQGLDLRICLPRRSSDQRTIIPPSLYLRKMFSDIPRSQTDRGPAAPRQVLRFRRGIRDRGPGRHDRWPVADVDIRDCEHASSAVHAVGDGDGGFVDG